MITTVSFEETERPTEWLRRLQEDASLYTRLLRDAGTLARAAHRLASARCRVAPVPSHVPSERELRTSAEEIARHTGTAMPVAADFLEDCARARLEVIRPMAKRAA